MKIIKFIYPAGKYWRWYLVDEETNHVYSQGTTKSFKTANTRVEAEWQNLLDEFELLEV